MVEALGVDLCVCNPGANQSRRGSARRRAPEQDRHGVREAARVLIARTFRRIGKACQIPASQAAF
jgi:hypothetical protein